MFQLLKEPNFDFIRPGKVLLVVSTIAVFVSVVIVAFKGVNLGIEFTGGTELQLKYVEKPDVAEIRARLHEAGIKSQIVTTIGDPEAHEVYIKVGEVEGASGQTDDLSARVHNLLRGDAVPPGRVDLNVVDQMALGQLLASGSVLEAEQLAAAIVEKRRKVAVFRSLDNVSDVPGMSASALAFLRDQSGTGPLALRSQSYIGPAVGRELVRNASLAILGSLLGMLAYIWFRFEFEWGVVAVLALVHDTVVSLGLFSLLGKEMSLPVVAAFLTLVGYSVNDTVVVFDRVRENLKNRVAVGDVEKLFNLSLNQTLSRTIITSGLTFLTVLGLLLFGGAALNAFSFVLTVGIVIGSYSTICIASPMLIVWKQYRERRQQRLALAGSASAIAPAGPPSPGAPAPRRAKKVRTS